MISSNIKEFNSFNKLFLEMENDLQTDNRYPVRFIFLNSFEELKKFMEYIGEISKTVSLDGMLDGSEWLSFDNILKNIKEAIKKDSRICVVPLSEFLRFSPKKDFYALLKGLSEIETNDKTKIYIPLVGLYKRFSNEFMEEFYRKDEWAPIWCLNGTSDQLTIYHADFDFEVELELEEFEIIRNTHDWFNLWKKTYYNDRFLSFSPVISFFHEEWLPDEIFNLRIIKNQKEFLNDIMNINVEIHFDEKESLYWNNLIKEFNKKSRTGIKSVSSLIKDYLNVQDLRKLKGSHFVKSFLNEKSDFYKWLIKSYFVNLKDKSYLTHCFKCMKTLENSELIEILWLEIFNADNIEEFYEERKEILKVIPLIEDFKIKNQLEKLEDLSWEKIARFITGILDVEKSFIIKKIENLEVDDLENIRPYLKDCFTDLYYYTDWDNIKYNLETESWILDYFKEYNISKIRYQFSENLKEIIEEKNRDEESFSKWFYKIEEPEIIPEELGVFNCWIDGLGVEWLPLIFNLIAEHFDDEYEINAYIRRVDLPSTTECNKYEFQKFRELDEYIHKEHYKHPETLINELKIIRDIIKEISNKSISGYNTINIYSDHGFSFLTLRKFNNKALGFDEAKHDGRYAFIEDNKNLNDEYYITVSSKCKDNSNVLVALKHASLSKRPSKETHGGATPEEVLVPYISLSKREEKIIYRLKESEIEVEISEPKVPFEIYPTPTETPKVLLNERELNIKTIGKGCYEIDVSDLKAGEYNVKINLKKQFLDLKINLKAGFRETDLF
ncbi:MULTISPECIES: BREX-4 system phosphatase PglZ [Methanothermobacter]|uniref:BREX-4 system phosphatase PglZ n=1 Tax=Methanothermobacter wolfeii TaxID=145261 RepID=A0A9E7RUJ5_METWO|nr:BREX-4 system phosphatase PglZ [Methanothermobacter wolfeii]UXH32546.1 BREX-4 system phosphatase PglZ [Methanothermobacter wolfeii]